MNVGHICQRKTVTVDQRAELAVAARLMRDRHIGYLVVIGHDPGTELPRPVGVLTDRDIVVAVIAKDTDPKTLRAGDVMTVNPVTVSESDSVERALQDMCRSGVRRVPVTGARGELVGVLSLDDLLELLAGQIQNVAGAVRNERRIEGALRT